MVSARAVKWWASKKFLVARCPGSAVASTPTHPAVWQCSTSAGRSSAAAGRLDSTSGELRDLAQDGVATPVLALVAADRLQRIAVEALEAFDHLRRRQLVVVGDRQRLCRRDVGPP